MKTKILVVDDEQDLLSTVKRYLEYSVEATVLTATNVEDALKIWRAESPSIILTDIDMPGGSGIDLLQAVKPHNPSTQVIIMTGKTTLDRALDCLAAGAVEYLFKPLDMSLMEKLVRESMERYERWYRVIKENLSKKRRESERKAA